MLNQLGSGSISCLRPAVETERLVRSNERQDHRSVLFCESTVTGPVYLDMLEQFKYPQVTAFQPSIIYQQDGAPPHWIMDVRGSLNATFPTRWIGLDGPICWPPRSPHLTPLDFLLEGPCICDSSEWYRKTTNPNPWGDCYNNRWNVNKNTSRIWVQVGYCSYYQWGACRGVLVRVK